jgi:putative glutamine amidotransferase
MADGPRIAITVADPAGRSDPDVVRRKNQLYADAIARRGGLPILLDASAGESEREATFAAMQGLLLSGGADLEPSRYGQPNRGSTSIEPERDALEADAFAAARRAELPVLGVCRGFQAMNAFLGGTLLQDVGDHVGAAWGRGPARTHPLRVAPGSRLARILFPTNIGGGVLTVNSYHHQAVTAAGLAAGLVANAWATSPAGDLVEGFESRSGRFLMGVQCHPERPESTPAAFERLWSVFVDACRGSAASRS